MHAAQTMAMTGGENASIRSGGQQTSTKSYGGARRPRHCGGARTKSKCGGNVTFAVAGVTTSVSNIEAVTGQLCPATLLARPLVASRHGELKDICSR
jgi:hypothetical protein